MESTAKISIKSSRDRYFKARHDRDSRCLGAITGLVGYSYTFFIDMPPQLDDQSFDIDQSPSHLPAEIKSLLVKCTPKSDLKNLRLASKEWNAHATPLLFDRIYISPYQKDLEVFTKITQSPVLASLTTELICDTSSVPKLSHEDYFHELRHEVRSITRWPKKDSPFHSSNRRTNRFVNGITQIQTEPNELFLKYGEEPLITGGFRLWQQMVTEIRRNLNGGSYYSALCAGLHRLPKLQAIKLDNDIWVNHRRNTSLLTPFSEGPYHVLGTVDSGSPLSRDWNPWHLRPMRSEDDLDAGVLRILHFVTQALSKTKTYIKRFKCDSVLRDGVSPCIFGAFKPTDVFPRHMVLALYRLERLELQITPCQRQLFDHGQAGALGFFPFLLEQMTDLKRLTLRLETDEGVLLRRGPPCPPPEDSCFNYSQVFPRHGRWPRLEMFYLRGLAIDALDLLILVYEQMPRLKRLWLNRIDLYGGKWEGIVQTFREQHPWELLGLQGHFRHKDREWWPCPPDKEEQESFALDEYMAYIYHGGRHPSLASNCNDLQAGWYSHQMFDEASEDHRRTFWNRVYEFRGG